MELLHSILLEGPDGAGKTCLFERMVGLWDFKSAGHDGGPPESAHEAVGRLVDFESQDPAVRDRCPAISDIVYSKALNRDPKLTEKEYKFWLKNFKPLVIYCRPPREVLNHAPIREKPHKTAKHAYQVAKERDRIIRNYDSLMVEWSEDGTIGGIEYDWTVDEDGSKLLSLLKERGICAD